MPSWDADQYLKFAAERTRPAEDLAARITIKSPGRTIDLGCGPGNSTAILARRWPAAKLVGLDQSAEMIKSARESHPTLTWVVGDIATWTADEPVDIVFSNAALQWVPDHARVLPHLLAQVAPAGVLAFQVPANIDAPGHRLLRELGHSTKWEKQFRVPVREWHVEEPSFYYEALAPHASHLELWTTDYVHILRGAEAIVDWYRGTGLRPWLEALADETARAEFIADYLKGITGAFPAQSDGNVLFPFRRLFAIAYR
jgi:trans-aconitate 2-methyltransferase